MNKLNELSKIIRGLERVKGDLLRTTTSDGLVYVVCLHKFINDNTLLKNEIDNIISKSDYNCENFVVVTGVTRKEICKPENEADRIKAMVNLLEEWATNPPFKNFAEYCGDFNLTNSSKYDDRIQAVLSAVFRPLIEYIGDFLQNEREMVLSKMKRKKWIISVIIGIAAIAIAFVGLFVDLGAWRFPVNTATTPTIVHNYVPAATVPDTASIPPDATELDDRFYDEETLAMPVVTPIVISENIAIVEGRTHRNDEIWLVVSPTRISSSEVTMNITTHGIGFRSQPMTSGQIEEFTFGERVFSFTLDEINWGAARESRHIVISIREYAIDDIQ